MLQKEAKCALKTENQNRVKIRKGSNVSLVVNVTPAVCAKIGKITVYVYVK